MIPDKAIIRVPEGNLKYSFTLEVARVSTTCQTHEAVVVPTSSMLCADWLGTCLLQSGLGKRTAIDSVTLAQLVLETSTHEAGHLLGRLVPGSKLSSYNSRS
jgi:hypothetical protein